MAGPGTASRVSGGCYRVSLESLVTFFIPSFLFLHRKCGNKGPHLGDRPVIYWNPLYSYSFTQNGSVAPLHSGHPACGLCGAHWLGYAHPQRPVSSERLSLLFNSFLSTYHLIRANQAYLIS